LRIEDDSFPGAAGRLLPRHLHGNLSAKPRRASKSARPRSTWRSMQMQTTSMRQNSSFSYRSHKPAARVSVRHPLFLRARRPRTPSPFRKLGRRQAPRRRRDRCPIELAPAAAASGDPARARISCRAAASPASVGSAFRKSSSSTRRARRAEGETGDADGRRETANRREMFDVAERRRLLMSLPKPGTADPPSENRLGHCSRVRRQDARGRGRARRVLLVGTDLCQPVGDRTQSHGHELERSPVLWAARHERAGAG